MNNDKLIIDLGKGKNLDESWLRMFGNAIQMILKAMFQGSSIPVSIKGSPGQIEAFVNTLQSEKNFIEAWKNYGLDQPTTWKYKYKLNKATDQFQRKTGLVWPFRS